MDAFAINEATDPAAPVPRLKRVGIYAISHATRPQRFWETSEAVLADRYVCYSLGIFTNTLPLPNISPSKTNTRPCTSTGTW